MASPTGAAPAPRGLAHGVGVMGRRHPGQRKRPAPLWDEPPVRCLAAQAAGDDLDQTNLLGLRALGALPDLELDLLTADEAIEIG